MTGSLAFDMLISLTAIALMVGISMLIGAWRNASVDEAAARERLAFDEPDFEPGRWLVSADGKAAVALSGGGDEAAFVFSVGDSLATRRLRVGAFEVACDGGDIIARIPDVSKPRIRLRAGDAGAAAEWAGGLGG